MGLDPWPSVASSDPVDLMLREEIAAATDKWLVERDKRLAENIGNEIAKRLR